MTMSKAFIVILGCALAACGHVAPAQTPDGTADTEVPDTTESDVVVDTTVTDTTDIDAAGDGEDSTGDAGVDTIIDPLTDGEVCTLDEQCGAERICRPACFGGDGCGAPPGSLVVDCPDTQAAGREATCSIALDGMVGQDMCLDCTVEAGTVVISRADFTALGGICGMEDWAFVAGNQCSDAVASCTPSGVLSACCSAAPSIVVDLDGDCVLRSDRATNCPSSLREWRVTQQVDTTGLSGIQVCFDMAQVGATDNEGLLLLGESDSGSGLLFCLNGPQVDGRSVDGLWYPYCVTLPAWAEDEASLELTFIAHSHDAADILYLDDIVVKGRPKGCPDARLVVFEEDFEPCPDTNPVADGWNGWTITGGPVCEDTCAGGTGGARVLDGTWTMTHVVDTTALDSEVRLCFDAGDDHGDATEELTVSFDAGDGSGWQRAWHWEVELGTDGTCRRVCLPLSDLDRDVIDNPALGIRFALTSGSDARSMFVDDIEVDGSGRCLDASVVTSTDPEGDDLGVYSVDVTSVTGGAMTVFLACSWDSPPTPVEGSDTFDFTPP